MADYWAVPSICGFLPRPTLYEALCSACAVSKLRFGFASLAWSCPRYAISDGGLTAIGAIGAIGAMGAMDAMGAMGGVDGGARWGVFWGSRYGGVLFLLVGGILVVGVF